MTAEEKQLQRRAGIAARRALPDGVRAEKNRRICRRLMALDEVRRADTVLAYAAFGGEADLTELLRWAEGAGKTVAYPVCLEDCAMVAAVPQGDDGWEVGCYGIRTPVLSRSRLLEPEELALVLVPCAAFDEGCWRVGMGKGYYDRYLPRCTRAAAVGVAFEGQKVSQAATDRYDRRLDACVTERTVYTWKR